MMLFNTVHAQSVKKFVREGDISFGKGDYYSAAAYYRKAMDIDSTIIEVDYKYAEACRIILDYVPAERWYSFVFKKDRGKKYPLSSFWQATMLKNLGRYKEAKGLYDKYYKKYKKKNDFYSRKAQHEVSACDFAILLRNEPKAVTIEHPDSNVNTVFAEFNPVYKDSILYFTSMRTQTEGESLSLLSRIYNAKRDGREWKPSETIDMELRDVNIGNITFTKDHKSVFFTLCDYKDLHNIRCEIYSGKYKGGRITDIERMDDNINESGYTNTQPHITENENKDQLLYFASDRPGGQGKMDIWQVLIDKKGKVYEPVNAGAKINTPDDEICPFYEPATRTLYFSSAWHKGLGGFDIFKAVPDSSGKGWKDPVNLGYPVNTSYNDLYYTVTGNEGFFTSNRPGSYTPSGETCCNDIYHYTWKARDSSSQTTAELDASGELKLTAAKEIQLLVPLTLYFHNDEPDPRTRLVKTKTNYADLCKIYTGMKTTYRREYSKGLEGEGKKEAEEDIDDYFSEYVDKGLEELERFSVLLLQNLEEGKEVTVTLKGYCSPLASTDYNVNLAKRRISSLRNYFDQHRNGILKKYMEDATGKEAGHLKFIEEDIGELQASPRVSDNVNDLKNAVYSRLAALERKIQIIAVSTRER